MMRDKFQAAVPEVMGEKWKAENYYHKVDGVIVTKGLVMEMVSKKRDDCSNWRLLATRDKLYYYQDKHVVAIVSYREYQTHAGCLLVDTISILVC